MKKFNSIYSHVRKLETRCKIFGFSLCICVLVLLSCIHFPTSFLSLNIDDSHNHREKRCFKKSALYADSVVIIGSTAETVPLSLAWIEVSYCPVNNSGYFIDTSSFKVIGYSLDTCKDFHIIYIDNSNKAIKDTRFDKDDLLECKTYYLYDYPRDNQPLPVWWHHNNNMIGIPSQDYRKKLLLYCNIYKPDSTFYKNICLYFAQDKLLGDHIGKESKPAFNDDTLILTLDYADTSQFEYSGNYNRTKLEMFLKKSNHTIQKQDSYNMEFSIDSLSIEFLTTQDTIWPDDYTEINNKDSFILRYDNISIPKNEVKINMSFRLSRTTEYGSVSRRYYWPLLAIP